MTGAVAYAIYCVGLEGLRTSLKPEEALIYLYDGLMVELSSQAACRLAITCTEISTTICMTIIEVDESLFWLLQIVCKPSRPTQ